MNWGMPMAPAKPPVAQRQRIDVGAVGQAEVLLQLGLKKALRLGAGGWLESRASQCGQRVQHPEGTHLLAINGFHAHDADDDFRGTPVCASARASVSRLSCQNLTPALMCEPDQ